MIEYRQAVSTDAEAIGLIHAQSFRDNVGRDFPESFLEEELPAELIELWQQRIERPAQNQFIQVALNDVNVVGFVCTLGAHDSRWGSLVDNLHVHHSVRKAGIGSALMSQTCAWLTTRYADTPVFLLVLESNTVARNFYEELGARNVETSTMETLGRKLVRNCRYTWANPQQMSVG